MRKETSNGNCEQMAYRFYGIPSEQDATQEDKTFGCYRYLWNRMLGDHNTLYSEIGEVSANTPADYKDLDECSWLNEVDSLALANVQLHLDAAFSRFFKKTSRYPKFKSRKFAKKSYTTNAVYSKKKDGNIRCNISLDPVSGLLKLPKHKDSVQLRLHRSIRPDGKLKSVTVTMEPDGKRYYSILMEYPKQELTRDLDPDNAIGLDMSAIKGSLRFGKSASDNGWGMFTDMLSYKAKRKGKQLVKVDRWFPSSKTCSHCDHIHKELKLSDRIYLCPKCGHTMDRDRQAAQNIVKEAKRMLLNAAF